MRASAARAAPPAGLVERGLAFLADSVVTLLVWVAILLVVAQGDVDALTDEPRLTLVAGLLFLTVPLAYFVLSEGLTGTTPGKALFGLAVVTGDGDPPGLFRATVRNVMRLAWELGPVGPLFLLLDVVLVQLSPGDQRVGDMAAETRVAKTRPGRFDGG